MKPYFETELGKLYCGDCLNMISGMESESIQSCITSPPYWGLRDYGVDGQLGLEKTPEEYVSKMVEIFREVRRVLRKDGTLWLNLGDSYAGSMKGANGDGTWQDRSNCKQGTNTGALDIPPQKAKDIGLKPKDMVGIPWRVAFALQQDGWYLRQDIIWHKPNPMPESVTDRCTKSHEYIFLMSKSAKYYYDNEAIKESDSGKNRTRTFNTIERVKERPTAHQKGNEGCGALWSDNGTRNKRSVWTVSTKPYKEAHFATFPPTLILPCILAGAAENQPILDPFAGSGTVWEMCEKYKRKSMNIELSEEYCQLIKKRIINETRQQKLPGF